MKVKPRAMRDLRSGTRLCARIAGRNIANPTAVLRSALLMLRHIGEADAAWKIRNAIDQVYRDRSKLTRDVGAAPGTSEFADAIIHAMESARTERAQKA